MVINSSKVKTEALLLICRDLITSYKQTEDDIFDIDKQTKDFIQKRIDDLLVAINLATHPLEYYNRNSKISTISMVIKTYHFIKNNLSKQFKDGDKFNPSMLCFSLLSTWFAELEITFENKELIYFSIYPYSEIYDKLLLNINNDAYKELNINMINIAEKSMFKLYKYRFK
ncbi:MAG: hypothetical protein U9O56_03400 [Campylobacterota bacterium]|nr:hypothetical protein [Campylobacterota bacterium]